MEENKNKEIGFLIKKIDEKLAKNMNEKLALVGLTFAQLKVLIFVFESPLQMTTQKEIENFLEVSHPTTNGIIKRLEEKDFLKTEMTLKNNRMSKNVMLTEKGADLCRNNTHDKDLFEKKFEEWLTKDEKTQLTALLEKIYTKISEYKG